MKKLLLAAIVSIGFIVSVNVAHAERVTSDEIDFTVDIVAELPAGKYFYRYNHLGTITVAHFSSKTDLPFLRIIHFDFGGQGGWRYGNPESAIGHILNGRKKRMAINNLSDQDFIRNKFGAFDYKTFDGIWIKYGIKRKCVAFVSIYKQNSRMDGVYCETETSSNLDIFGNLSKSRINTVISSIKLKR